MKPRDILKHELIGLDIEIVDSSNKSLIGKKGTIIDETRNSFVLKDSNGQRIRLLKNVIVFRVKLNSALLEINGKETVGRPEDRLKKKR